MEKKSLIKPPQRPRPSSLIIIEKLSGEILENEKKEEKEEEKEEEKKEMKEEKEEGGEGKVSNENEEEERKRKEREKVKLAIKNMRGNIANISPFPPLANISSFPPDYPPPPLELTKEESEMEIKLPEKLPDYPSTLLPKPNEEINLPAIICNIQSPKLSNSPYKARRRTKEADHVENIPIGRVRTNTSPNYLSLNISFGNIFSANENNRKVSDGNFVANFLGDISFNASSPLHFLPEGEEEEVKRKRRKERRGKSYQTADDIPLPPLPLPPEEIERIRERSFTFTEYANKYFKTNLEKNSKKKLQFATLISHSKKISTSLHHFDQSKELKISFDLFKKIKFYMLDKKSIDKHLNEDPLIIAQQIVDLAFFNPLLHDELYALLIKQLCNNPSKASEGRGWELMGYITSTFPPRSGDLRQVVKTWLIDQNVRNADVASFCFHSLQRSIDRSTPRKRPPSLFELHFLRERAQIECRMESKDGTQIVIKIDSTTTIDRVFHTFCDRSKIDYPYRDFFQIFIACGSDEREVEGGYAVDCMRQFEALFSSSKFELSNYKFYVKLKIFLRRRHPIQSDVINRLLYYQLKQEIITGELPIIKQEKEIIEISSIILQHELGDFDQNKSIKLEQFLPQKLLNQQLIDKIKSNYFAMMATSKIECRRKFVSIIQRLQFFGSSVYEIDLVSATEKYGVEVKKVVINEDGLALYNDDLSNIADRFIFEDITAKLKGEWVEVIKKNSSIKFTCKSPLGNEMIIREYAAYISAFTARSSTGIAIDDHIVDENDENDRDLLPFKKGDLIKIYIPNDGNNWEYGEVDHRTGNYPSHLVKHLWNSSSTLLI